MDQNLLSTRRADAWTSGKPTTWAKRATTAVEPHPTIVQGQVSAHQLSGQARSELSKMDCWVFTPNFKAEFLHSL